MKYLSIIIFIITSWNLSAQQQLLTPYSGTLSSTAQQRLLQLQADTTLTQIGIYEVNGKAFYDNTLNVNFGNQSFQFFLDRRAEVAMRKVWQGSSILGDKISILYRGSKVHINLTLPNGVNYKIYNLENDIHVIFLKKYTYQEYIDKCGFVGGEQEEEVIDNSKSNDFETHCPLRVGIAITDRLIAANGIENIKSEVLDRILQSNNVYSASRSGELFDGISIELAYIRYFPFYSEILVNDTMKLEERIMAEFSTGQLGNTDLPHSVTRDYFDADFCGLIYRSNDRWRTGGGLALGHRASYNTAYFLLEEAAAFTNFRFSFTHEIGHLFGCSHDINNVRVIYKNSYTKGHFSLDEQWATVMSYRQDGECTRVGFHSNPFLNSSSILTPPTPDLVGNIFPTTLNMPMGTVDGEFCMNGIADTYLTEINLESTTSNRLNTSIRTDFLSINTPTVSSSPNMIADQNTFYADLLTVNDITFLDKSFIIDGYERLLRAGNSIDIDSNSDESFEFDAQNGSVVDISIVNFAESTFDCRPNNFRRKTNEIDNNISTPKEKDFYLTVIPNPTSINPTINFKLTENSRVNLWITNFLGQTVSIIKKNIVLEKGTYKEKINIQGLSSGTYQVSITINGDKKSSQFIISK